MKVKHTEMLECVEARTLFKILGRHRAIREINKGKLSCKPLRRKTGERSIMDNVFWHGSKNEYLWEELHFLHYYGPKVIHGARHEGISTLRKYYRIKLTRAATCE